MAKLKIRRHLPWILILSSFCSRILTVFSRRKLEQVFSSHTGLELSSTVTLSLCCKAGEQSRLVRMISYWNKEAYMLSFGLVSPNFVATVKKQWLTPCAAQEVSLNSTLDSSQAKSITDENAEPNH